MSDVSPPQLSTDRAVELVTAYLGAWAERRTPARRRLLHHCWTETTTFSAWTTHVDGLDAMDAHIANALRQLPRRCRRVRTSDVHVRHGKLSYTWVLIGDDDEVLLEGSEFAEVGADGRFRRVTSFAGRPAPDDADAEPATVEGWL
ncbi:MAG: nuclear transport factor 2 family protein [Acidimicrobiia bacterium]|nr:nuclear transport factor 2 family protein [Acidimicrobiia bacterium]